jgi:hypothetical protein
MEDLKRKLTRFLSRDLPDIVSVEGLNFINKNFRDQGFTGSSFKKWKPRATKDKRGRNITRYKSNRGGRVGGLTQYGRRNDGRAILTGYRTGGNKLKNSFRARGNAKEVRFYTTKEYAERHNEGDNSMPKRQFIGKSAYLENRIKRKLAATISNIFR